MDENIDTEYIPPELFEAANEALQNTLPEKSKFIYEKAYDNLIQWMATKKTNSFSEIVLLAYFNELSKTMTPASLRSKYSMLRTMINLNKNIQISEYAKLKNFIKKKNVEAKVKKANVFSTSEMSKFLKDAPDETCLAYKVILVLGVAGACRRDELYKMSIDHVKREGSVFIIELPDTKTHISRTFVVQGNHLDILDKYVKLRPPNVDVRNFFLTYRNGKCSKQVMGINTIGGAPRKIAEWLKLPNAAEYTGHSFRRTSATVLSDAGGSITELKRHGGWRSTTVAESYIQDSLNNKKKISQRITNAIEEGDSSDDIPSKRSKQDIVIDSHQSTSTSAVNQHSITPYIRLN